MRHLLFIALGLGSLVAAAGCADDGTSFENTFTFDLDGERHVWRTNDASCELRSMGSVLACLFDVGVNEEETDFLLTLNLDGEEVDSRTYVDRPEEAFPDIEVELWIDLESGQLATTTATEEDRFVEVVDLEETRVVLEVECWLDSEGGEAVELSGDLDMVLE